MNRKILTSYFFLLNCLAISFSGQSQIPIFEIRDFEAGMLGKEIRVIVLEDCDCKLTPNQAYDLLPGIGQPADYRFNYGTTHCCTWLFWTMSNPDPLEKALAVELVNPYIDKSDLFELVKDSSGNRWELNYQERKVRNDVFYLDISPGDTLTVALKVGSSLYPLNFNVYLWDNEYRVGHQQLENIILGSFLGLLLLYIFIITVSIMGTRMRYQWWYLTFMLLGAFFVVIDSGLAKQFIWTENPIHQQIWTFFVVNLYLVTGTIFVRRHFYVFTGRKQDNLIKIFIIAGLTLAPLSLFLAIMPKGLAWFILNTHYVIYLFCCIMVPVYVMYAFYKFRTAEFLWFTTGYSLHGLGIVILLLQHLGVPLNGIASAWLLDYGLPPYTIYTNPIFMLGVIVEMMVIYYQMINRYRSIHRKNQQVMLELSQQKEKNMQSLMMGIETERKRIAQDLHDGLGVLLSSIKMGMTVLKEKNSGNEVAAELDHQIKQLDKAHQEIRNLSHNIMPKAMQKGDLKLALEELILHIKSSNPQIRIFFYTNIPHNSISEMAQINIYRIIQELINNVLKHANATELSIQLLVSEQEWVLTVEDNGKGFDSEKPNGGMGLKNISHRAQALNGKVQVESKPGKGAMFTVTFPKDSLFG